MTDLEPWTTTEPNNTFEPWPEPETEEYHDAPLTLASYARQHPAATSAALAVGLLLWAVALPLALIAGVTP